jgi:protein-tyrosine phosphatase
MTGFYDIHTHILPHVDDGARDMEETLNILKMEYEDGVRTIYATSHYRRNMFEPSMVAVWEQYERVRKAAAKIGEGIRILPGCEFHANLDMIEMLDAGERPTMGDSRCVLVEFSNGSDRQFIKERCYALLSHGYQPIVAHAERYRAVRSDKGLLEQLADMGAYIQMNAQSILGEDGFMMKRFCKNAMKADLIHFVASDAHNTGKRRPTMGKCAAYIEKVMGTDYMERLLIENPKYLIEED